MFCQHIFSVFFKKIFTKINFIIFIENSTKNNIIILYIKCRGIKLKKSTIRVIIEALYKHRKLSKSDISKLTNLSSTTISTYTDYLLDRGIITSSYSNAKKGDRKCIRFNLNHNKYFVIYDFSDNEYLMHICNLTGKIRKTFKYSFISEYSFEENKYCYLKSVDYQLRKYGKNGLCGTAVIYSDNYDNNLIQKARFNSLISSLYLGENVFINKSKIYRSEFIKEHISSDNFALCLFLNKENFSSCFITSSSDISKLHFIEIGESFKVKDIPIKDYIDYMEDITDIIEQLSALIKTVYETAPISQVYITGNFFKNMDALTALISEDFKDNKLSFNYINDKDFISFIVKILRNTMSDSLIRDYLNK